MRHPDGGVGVAADGARRSAYGEREGGRLGEHKRGRSYKVVMGRGGGGRGRQGRGQRHWGVAYVDCRGGKEDALDKDKGWGRERDRARQEHIYIFLSHCLLLWPMSRKDSCAVWATGSMRGAVITRFVCTNPGKLTDLRCFVGCGKNLLFPRISGAIYISRL